jgi:hypothetical protein
MFLECDSYVTPVYMTSPSPVCNFQMASMAA